MRGSKSNAVDEDYEVGADKEDKHGGSDKPLSSQYRGVCWNRKNKRWQAAINSGGKYVYLGSFLSEYDAARAFDKAAVKLRGTRAKLNFSYSDYVDEHGNLLEDPKMKNVMYKIEVMQGCGGAGGHTHHDSGSDHDGARGHTALQEDGASAGGPHRHMLPFPPADGAAGKPGGGPGAGAGSDWQIPSRGVLHLALAGANGGEAGVFPTFTEAGTSGQPLPLSGGPGGRVAGGSAGAAARNRTPGPGPYPGGQQQQSAAQMLQELSPYAGAGAAGGGAFAALGLSVNGPGDQTPPPGAAPARGHVVSTYTQRAIMRELKPSCQILAYVPVPSRYSTPEEMCGVLFHDSESPSLIGSAAWTGSTILLMGMYDTDRDARQAAIRCMQLYNSFCKEEWRADFYNALTAMGGDQHLQPSNPGSRGPRETLAARHPQASAAGGSSTNTSINVINAASEGGLQAAATPLPLPGAYGSRSSARGSNSSSGLVEFQVAHGADGALQEPAPAAPYVRTSGGGTAASAGAGFVGGDNCPAGRSGLPLPLPPASGAGFGPPQQQQPPLESACEGLPPGGAGAAPLAIVSPPTMLNELFQYMASFKGKATDASDGPASESQGGGRAGSAHGKRSAPGEHLTHQQRTRQLDEPLPLPQQQRKHEQGTEPERGEAKRLRLDLPAATGGGATEEFRAAHKLPLSELVKQLEQAAAGR